MLELHTQKRADPTSENNESGVPNTVKKENGEPNVDANKKTKNRIPTPNVVVRRT